MNTAIRAGYYGQVLIEACRNKQITRHELIRLVMEENLFKADLFITLCLDFLNPKSMGLAR